MLGQLVWRGFAFAYGSLMLTIMTTVAAYRDKEFWTKTSEDEKRAIADAQEKYWGLNKAPLPGFEHAFCKLKNGTKLHYVVNGKSRPKGNKIAIFIHGFPDSYLLWKHILQSPSLAEYTLIAVDLPGYGGSDSLNKYGAGEVLEAITAFILSMRQQYLEEGGKVVMVAHDWGGIISTRLASEAKELADRWIIAGAVIPAQLYSSGSTLLASSKQMLHTYLTNPLNTRLLKKAYHTSQPVLSQLGRSYYIFIFQLPQIFANFSLRMGNYWFINAVHKIQAGKLGKGVKTPQRLTTEEVGEGLALSGGPGVAQTKDTVDGEGYSESVHTRAKDYGVAEKIRLYREGLGTGVWEKSIEAVVALSEIPVDAARSGSGAGLFEDGPPGALKVPTTLIHGRHDTAFEHKLGLNGIGDYLTRGSQVLVLEKCAHWTPLDVHGRKIIGKIVTWALEGEEGTLKELVGDYQGEITFLLNK